MEAMPMEDRYKELFNDPNLGNEDWLEPRPELLGSIKAELYPVKKDRSFLYLFISLGFISALLISLFIFRSQQNKLVGELENNSLENSLESNTSIQKEVKKPEFKEEKETAVSSNENKISSDFENQKKNTNSDLNSNSNNVTKIIKRQSEVITEPNIPVLSSSKQRTNNFTTENLKESKIENFLNTEAKVLEKNKFLNISPLAYLKTMGLAVLEYSLDSANFNFEAKKYGNLIGVVNDNSKAWGVEVGAGYVITDFILNSNYLTALNPADFTKEPGNGQYIQLRVYKKLNERLSFKLDGTYSRTVFNSGHNSEVIYSLQDEDSNQSITFDMPMATPLGFINSEIVIERASNTVEDQTDIIVDLQNQHTLNMIDLTVGADYNLINRNKINLNVFSSYGITYLLDVENEFRSFTPSVSGFNSGASQITTDQQNINNLLPIFDVGLNAKYQIRKGASIGIEYMFRSNLNPIFEMDDFNSSMKRNQLGINFQLDIN